jgi:hypothetical protein
VSSTLIEFLHGSPFFVMPQQEPGPPLGLTSISQTRNGFQGSMVVIEVVVKGRKCFGLWWCRAITAAFRQLYMPSPGLLTYMAAWLAWSTSLKQSVRRRRHSHALCAVYSRSVACVKGYHSRSLLQSAALVAVHRGDHTLANGLATAVGSEVDKCCVRFWVAYEFRSA